MSIVNHEFTDKIIEILNRHSGDSGRFLLKRKFKQELEKIEKREKEYGIN